MQEYCDAKGNPLVINTEDAAQIPEGYEHAGKIVANSNSQDDGATARKLLDLN